MSFESSAVDETAQCHQYFSHRYSNTEHLLHVSAECKRHCSHIAFKKIALKAIDRLLAQYPDACTAAVYRIVKRKTVYYVAKCRQNDTSVMINQKISMKAWYLPYPNVVGTHYRVRGRASGSDAIEFLRKLGIEDPLQCIDLEKKCKRL